MAISAWISVHTFSVHFRHKLKCLQTYIISCIVPPLRSKIIKINEVLIVI